MLPRRRWIRDWSVGEILIFADIVDDVHAKAIRTSVQPEAHNLMDRFTHGRVLPVEVWLFCREEMQVVFVGFLVILPGTS